MPHPAKSMKLYGVMSGKLARELVSADGNYKIPKGEVVEFQFGLDTEIVVVPLKHKAQRSITAAMKEIAGSELLPQ